MQNENLESLIEKAKSASSSTPLQRVQPLKIQNETIEEEVQIAFYLPKYLYKKVKLKAIEKETSIKAILNHSIHSYIESVS